MIITELNIPCVWGGILKGILLKNDTIVTSEYNKITTKIIGIHGWLDNFNSLLPMVEKLIDHHPNYEIYLYDRAGHGFSSHLPKGFDYSHAHNLEDLRIVVQALGWNKEKFSIIGHSYGAILGMIYAASYPDDIVCLVAIDALVRPHVSSDLFWTTIGSRIDNSLQYLSRKSKIYTDELTFEKAVEHTKNSRPGITDEAAKLLTERAVRRDSDNKLHFTRDESLKLLSLFPFTDNMVENVVQAMKGSILFIGATNPQWPRPSKTIDLLKKYHLNFEMTLIDGPHHFHMTHIDEVVNRIEQYFDKYLQQSSIPMIQHSQL
ncbi:unnamed protein product [Rotaria sordida]|uniref:AB hydrolase-1 domain-containing protein n=1 Tax=Rotaria sordida TaxID=392033 RepID=A0A814BYL7_9BILA|nr:unnamed protein product [Rotaria sordida]CAF1029251.1 unnamed protein product [Rotaria sordida]CAF3996191.1 unnamed protein product [Rotaria sordida]CAF4012918.1 unnamed protein product [Rotaria sordida]